MKRAALPAALGTESVLPNTLRALGDGSVRRFRERWGGGGGDERKRKQ